MNGPTWDIKERLLKWATLAIERNSSEPLWTLITETLQKYGAKIIYFIAGDSTSDPVPDDAFYIVPESFKLSTAIHPGRVLRWKQSNTQWIWIDLYDISPNNFAQKVAELINESKFKLPEWFEGYNFRWEWTVIKNPATKERCRKMRLFKTFEEWNVRETYVEIYLDEQGQLFTVSMEKQPLPLGARIFTVQKEEPTKKILTAESEIEVKNRLQERPTWETHPQTEHISFFKTTES